MAISKVSQYNSTPSVVADYQAQNAHLQAMINQANGSVGILTQATIGTIPSIKQGTYISFGGVLYIVDTEDYTILGTAIAGDNYIRLEASGDNLTATWVQTITSYSWNSVYNYYTDGTYVLLPYIVNYATNYYISRFDQNFNQTLKKEDDVIFNGIRKEWIYLDENEEPQKILISNAKTGSSSIGIVGTAESTSTSYVKVGEVVCVANGTVNTYMGLRDGSGVAGYVYGRVYVNGVAVGAERSTSSDSYVYFSEDITVNYGDLIQLYVHGTAGYAVLANLNVRTLYGTQGYTDHS